MFGFVIDKNGTIIDVYNDIFFIESNENITYFNGLFGFLDELLNYLDNNNFYPATNGFYAYNTKLKKCTYNIKFFPIIKSSIEVESNFAKCYEKNKI